MQAAPGPDRQVTTNTPPLPARRGGCHAAPRATTAADLDSASGAGSAPQAPPCRWSCCRAANGRILPGQEMMPARPSSSTQGARIAYLQALGRGPRVGASMAAAASCVLVLAGGMPTPLARIPFPSSKGRPSPRACTRPAGQNGGALSPCPCPRFDSPPPPWTHAPRLQAWRPDVGFDVGAVHKRHVDGLCRSGRRLSLVPRLDTLPRADGCRWVAWQPCMAQAVSLTTCPPHPPPNQPTLNSCPSRHSRRLTRDVTGGEHHGVGVPLERVQLRQKSVHGPYGVRRLRPAHSGLPAGAWSERGRRSG